MWTRATWRDFVNANDCFMFPDNVTLILPSDDYEGSYSTVQVDDLLILQTDDAVIAYDSLHESEAEDYANQLQERRFARAREEQAAHTQLLDLVKRYGMDKVHSWLTE